MDTLTSKERSSRMRLIKSRDTTPEMAVRRLVHSMGFRYRLHSNKLAGRPDLIFSSQRKAIFVHGCFWHQHSHCRNSRVPKSRLEYWIPKLRGNKIRDRKNNKKLEAAGWKVLVIWECEVKYLKRHEKRIKRFLSCGITRERHDIKAAALGRFKSSLSSPD